MVVNGSRMILSFKDFLNIKKKHLQSKFEQMSHECSDMETSTKYLQNNFAFLIMLESKFVSYKVH